VLAVRLLDPANPAGKEVDPSLLSELLASGEGLLWIEARDPSEAEIALLGSELELHPLAMEDMLHRGQRPKIEPYPGYLFVVVHGLRLAGEEVLAEELHCVLGPRYLLTLTQGPAPELAPAKAALERRPDLLAEGAASLLYAVLDAVVDSYFGVLEALAEQLERLEAGLFADRPDFVLEQELFAVRRRLLVLRRSLLPVRDALSLLGGPGGVATPKLEPYYRDVADHVVRALETAETLREMLTSTLEVHLTAVSNRLNLAMKKLTAWGAIILVPTLIAGVYGMNFTHMPELDWAWGYPFALFLMGSSASALYLVFRRKGWL
jgi:magnesium transporter